MKHIKLSKLINEVAVSCDSFKTIDGEKFSVSVEYSSDNEPLFEPKLINWSRQLNGKLHVTSKPEKTKKGNIVQTYLFNTDLAAYSFEKYVKQQLRESVNEDWSSYHDAGSFTIQHASVKYAKDLLKKKVKDDEIVSRLIKNHLMSKPAAKQTVKLAKTNAKPVREEILNEHCSRLLSPIANTLSHVQGWHELIDSATQEAKKSNDTKTAIEINKTYLAILMGLRMLNATIHTLAKKQGEIK